MKLNNVEHIFVLLQNCSFCTSKSYVKVKMFVDKEYFLINVCYTEPLTA